MPDLTPDMPRICVLGLGYIGLPSASLFASQGADVLGVDTDPERLAVLRSGKVPIQEPGLKVLVEAAMASGRLQLAEKPEPADVFVLALPTPITPDHKADLTAVRQAAETLVPLLRAGNLVILESTVPPRTTDGLLRPILERSGLAVGRDLYLAHCPERVLPGRILQELVTNDRVIGGVTPACADKARAFYARVADGECHLTTATTAETVKLLENTYRDVNIALANEVAQVCERLGVNVWEAITLANRHPRVHLHAPGPGVGGHCIAVDPWFLVETCPDDTPLIRQARARNDGMPRHVVGRVLAAVNRPDPVVTVLGVTYKGNVEDTRESPAQPIIAGLRAAGATVKGYDPRVRAFAGLELDDLEGAFAGSDCALLLADHKEFRYLAPGPLGELMRRRLVFDTRRHLDLATWQVAGFDTLLLGA